MTNDYDRAPGVRRHVLAHGADQQPGDLAVPSCPYHQEAGAQRVSAVDQRATGEPFFDVGVNGQPGVVIPH